MPSSLKRLHHSGQAHFLTFSCYHRLPLLEQWHLQEAFLAALEQTRRRFQMFVFGFVLMPEHVHLLVSEPTEKPLARAMQILKTRVAIQARRQGSRDANGPPLWQDRYFDHNVRNHAGFVTQLRYIHRNPVKRGLCKDPQDWPWSSFRAWAVGEIGIAEVECPWTAARREAEQGLCSPALSAETSGKDGARRISGSLTSPRERKL